MSNFIFRNWRGESPFWVSFLAWTIVFPLLTFLIVTLWLTQWSMQDTPSSRMFQGVIGFLLIGLVSIWQLVGMWRASAPGRSTGRWWMTRWLARTVAVIVGIAGLLMLTPFSSGMVSLYQEATDQDWIGQQGHTVLVDDTNLQINGYLAWGVLGEVSRALASNPAIQTVVLNSPGGHVGVGTRLYDEIRSRNLDTYAEELCASACTLAFLGGAHRYVRTGAKLGFHAVGGEGANSIGAGTNKIRSLFQEIDVPGTFVEHVFATPSDSVWYPSRKELLGAHIVTDVIN